MLAVRNVERVGVVPQDRVAALALQCHDGAGLLEMHRVAHAIDGFAQRRRGAAILGPWAVAGIRHALANPQSEIPGAYMPCGTFEDTEHGGVRDEEVGLLGSAKSDVMRLEGALQDELPDGVDDHFRQWTEPGRPGHRH